LPIIIIAIIITTLVIARPTASQSL